MCTSASRSLGFLKRNIRSQNPALREIFHASNDSSSQIDYFLVAGSPSWSPLIKITIANMHYLNMSDHTHLELSLKLTVPLSLPEPSSQDQVRDIKIRWDKSDTSLYNEVVQESLLAAPLLQPLSAPDADLCVRSLTKVLHWRPRPHLPYSVRRGLGRDSQSGMRELQQHTTDGSVPVAQEVIVDS